MNALLSPLTPPPLSLDQGEGSIVSRYRGCVRLGIA
jgi:hypothetical protein